MIRILAIETGIEPEYENALIAAALNQGWKVQSVQNIPFTNKFVTGSPNMGTPLDDELLQNPNVWFHGSIQAAKRAQLVTAWDVHAPWRDLKCSDYYPRLAVEILQRDHVFMTLADLHFKKKEIFSSNLVEDGSLFVRPDGNDKIFTGGCITLETFDADYKLINFYQPPANTLVVVARPQRITAEARFLVVDSKLITGSYYRTGGNSLRLEAPGSLMSKAQGFLDYCLEQGYNPALSWVLDLAETPSGWKIIEVGATSCCGLYKCDLDLFVSALDESFNNAD